MDNSVVGAGHGGVGDNNRVASGVRLVLSLRITLSSSKVVGGPPR